MQNNRRWGPLLLPSDLASWPSVKLALSAAHGAASKGDHEEVYMQLRRACWAVHHHVDASQPAAMDMSRGPEAERKENVEASLGSKECAALLRLIEAAHDVDRARLLSSSADDNADVDQPSSTLPGCLRQSKGFAGTALTAGSVCMSRSCASSIAACSILGLLPGNEAANGDHGNASDHHDLHGDYANSHHLATFIHGNMAAVSPNLKFGLRAFEEHTAANESVVFTLLDAPPRHRLPLALSDWRRHEAPLCPVHVTCNNDLPVSRPGDMYLEMVAAASMIKEAQRPASNDGALVIEVVPATDEAQTAANAKEHEANRAITMLGDLAWLTRQYTCDSPYNDCHILWQLAMSFLHVARLSAPQPAGATHAVNASDEAAEHKVPNQGDTGAGAYYQGTCRQAVRAADVESDYTFPTQGSGVATTVTGHPEQSFDTVFERSRASDEMHSEPDNWQGSRAAEPFEEDIPLHCASRLRSPPLVTPAIVVYESVGDDFATSGSCSDDDVSCCSVLSGSPPTTSQHEQREVSSFADALAASLLGDALTRPRAADSERRPSMPTIVEEALSGCLTTLCCSGGGNDKPSLCDFAERLAADVVMDALRMSRCDGAPVDDGYTPVGGHSEDLVDSAFAELFGCAAEQQALEDFSCGLLASVITEAKREWFGRPSAVHPTVSSPKTGTCHAPGLSCEHAKFFHREFVDRPAASSCMYWQGRRRRSEPTGWAVAAGMNMERRGSAPCVSSAKRMRSSERRPSDYFDDEFLRGLRSGRRGSAPAAHSRGFGATNDEYFAAEFVATSYYDSASLTGSASESAVCSYSRTRLWDDAAALPVNESYTEAMSYLSLYSDVLLENVMHATFRDLAKRFKSAGGDAENEAQLGADELAADLACDDKPYAGRHAPGVSDSVLKFVEQLVDDVFSSLRSTSVLDVASPQLVPSPAAAHESSLQWAQRRRSSDRRRSCIARSEPQYASRVPALAANWDGSATDENSEQLSALLNWVAASAAGAQGLDIVVSQGLIAEKLEAVARQALAMQLRIGQLASLVFDYCDMMMQRPQPPTHDHTLQAPFAYVSEKM